jgi:hypothetical protein
MRCRPVSATDRVATQVRKLSGFEIAKDLLGRIELRRVDRQAFDGQPRALVVDPIGHAPTPVGRQAIPQQHYPAARFKLMHIPEELD